MRMHRLISKATWAAAATLLFALLLAPDLKAQGDLRVEAFGGGSVLKGERTFIADGEPFRSSFANGGKFGFRGTLDLTKHWAVEGAYSYGANNLRLADLGEVPPVVLGFGTRVHEVSGNALYFLNETGSRLRPFLTAGIGFARYNPTSEAKTTAAALTFAGEPTVINGTNQPDFNFGAGLEAKLTDHWGARFDLRDHLTGLPTFGVTKALFPVSGTAQNIEYSLGIVFHLRP